MQSGEGKLDAVNRFSRNRGPTGPPGRLAFCSLGLADSVCHQLPEQNAVSLAAKLGHVPLWLPWLLFKAFPGPEGSC